MYAQYSTAATKAVVFAAKENVSDFKLTQGRGTHDARLDRNVDINVFENADGVIGHDLVDSHELCMSCTLPVSQPTKDTYVKGFIRSICSTADDFTIVYENTTDRRF